MSRGISVRVCVNVNEATHEGDYTCMMYELIQQCKARRFITAA